MNSTPTSKPTAQYTPIEYWNCVTRHQDKDQASQKDLEDCLELYRKIDQTQSNQFVFNCYISCCDVRIKINRDRMSIALPRDLITGFINKRSVRVR